MPIRLITIGKSKPGEGSQGEKKYYASVKSSGEDTLEDITKKIEKISTVSGADIRGVLYALVDTMKLSFADGRIVRLGELGSFRVSVSSQAEDSPSDVGARSITQARVIYKPDKSLKDWLKTLGFRKVQ